MLDRVLVQMNEPWWFDHLRDARATCFTAVSYLLTALLFWLGWKLTEKITADWLRVVLRAGLVAIAFAPAVFMDPGGLISIMPASVATIGSAVLYTVSGLAFGFFVFHALVSMCLVWCIGAIVGGVSMKLR